MKEANTKKSVLWVMLSILLVVSNIVVVKQFTLSNINFSGSLFIYPITFLIIVLIREFYDEKESLKAILMALFCQMFVIFALAIVSLLPVAAGFEAGNEIIKSLVKDFPTICFSLIAFTIAQLMAVKIYPTLKKYLPYYLSAGITMLFALALDSVIFTIFLNLDNFVFVDVIRQIAGSWFGQIIVVCLLTAVFIYVTSYVFDKEKTKPVKKTVKK